MVCGSVLRGKIRSNAISYIEEESSTKIEKNTRNKRKKKKK